MLKKFIERLFYKPVEIPPMATVLDDHAEFYDCEGTNWTVRTSGRLVFLSTNDGLDQFTFDRDTFLTAVRSL